MVYVRQENHWDCGPVSMKMVLALQGVERSVDQLVAALKTTQEEGTKHRRLVRYAQHMQMDYIVQAETSVPQLKRWLADGYSIIVAYFDVVERYGHYAVVKEIKDGRVYLLDPFFGPQHSYSIGYFYKLWHDSEGYRRWALAVRNR